MTLPKELVCEMDKYKDHCLTDEKCGNCMYNAGFQAGVTASVAALPEERDMDYCDEHDKDHLVYCYDDNGFNRCRTTALSRLNNLLT